MHIPIFILVIAATLAPLSLVAAQPQETGQVEFVKGQVTAQVPRQQWRKLKVKKPIFRKDLVKARDRSFSVLRLNDHGKVTVRPNSLFSVLNFQDKLPPEEQQHLEAIAQQGGWPELPDAIPLLKPGMESEVVPDLRRRLTTEFNLAPQDETSSLYDPELVATVKRFQQQQGLAVDGIVGSGTLAKLNIPVEARLQSKVAFKLDSGGVTVETGDIPTENPDQLTIETPLGIISGQQGQFRVRLCNNDCAMENKELGKDTIPQGREVVARIVDRTGEVYAQQQAPKPGDKRPLQIGAPLYRSDLLVSGVDSHLTAAFRDGGRITLNANSQMSVEDYRYEEQGHKEISILRLIKGGLRALTGKLGKSHPDAYSLMTPVATIGVRGTLFDLLCPGDCQPGRSDNAGILSHVRDGEIVIKNNAGSHPGRKDETHRIADPWYVPTTEPQTPAGISQNSAPAPETIPVDMENHFRTETLNGVPYGLYLYVLDGHIRMTGTKGAWNGVTLNFGRKEAGYISKVGELIRLVDPKAFQLEEDDSTRFFAAPVRAKPKARKPPPRKRKASRRTERRPRHTERAPRERYRPRERAPRERNRNAERIMGTIIKGLIIHGGSRSRGRDHNEGCRGRNCP